MEGGKKIDRDFRVLEADNTPIALGQGRRAGFPGGCVGQFDLGEGHDDQKVPWLAQVRGGAIQADLTSPSRGRDGVSLESLPIGQIAHKNLLIGKHADEGHKLAIEGEGTLVIEPGSRNLGSEKFGAQQVDKHGAGSSFSIGMVAFVKQLCINSSMSAKHRGFFSSLGESIASFAVDVVYERRKGVGARLLGGFLRVLSWVFELIVRTRLWLYRNRLFRDTPLGCKVVVVGNLTVGGTGKTPIVLKMARVLARRGRKVAILSRGYKGASDSMAKRFWRWMTQGSRPDPLVVSDGKSVLVGPDEAGDEPFMLAQNLSGEGVVVIVDRDRVEGGRFALRRFGVDTILLDDGLQYLPLRGQINLLLVDSRDPFGNGSLLPRGILREPVANLSRASYVFVTKSVGPPSAELIQLIRRHNAKAEIIACAHSATELVEVDGPGRHPMSTLAGKRIAAFSGIATPERFEETLKAHGAVIVANRRFLDHHAFNDEDLDEVLDQAMRAKAEMILTTEKDAVRLQSRFRPPIPLMYVRLEVEILGDREGFNAAVERICLGPSSSSR